MKSLRDSRDGVNKRRDQTRHPSRSIGVGETAVPPSVVRFSVIVLFRADFPFPRRPP